MTPEHYDAWFNFCTDMAHRDGWWSPDTPGTVGEDYDDCVAAAAEDADARAQAKIVRFTAWRLQ